MILVLELLLILRRVRRDPQDHRAGLLQILVCVTEPGRFNRSAWCVGFRKEKEDYILAAKILQRDFFAILVRQRKVWGFIIDIHEGFSVSFTVIPYRRQRRHAGGRSLDV